MYHFLKKYVQQAFKNPINYADFFSSIQPFSGTSANICKH